MVNLWTKGMLFCVVGVICLNTEFVRLLQKDLNFINLITLNIVSNTRIPLPFWSWEINEVQHFWSPPRGQKIWQQKNMLNYFIYGVSDEQGS